MAVEEFFIDECGADAAVKFELFALEEEVAGTKGGGGAEGYVFDGVVELVVFSEGVPAFGLVELRESAAVDCVERRLIGGLNTVRRLIIGGELEREFLRRGFVIEFGGERVGCWSRCCRWCW